MEEKVTCVKGGPDGPWSKVNSPDADAKDASAVEDGTKNATGTAVANVTGEQGAEAKPLENATGMDGGKRKSKKSAKKSTRKSSTRKNKKSNKKGKKTQKGGSSLAHSDVNASQSIATSVDNKLSLAGSIESGLFPGVQKITGGMTPTPKSMMGGANTPTPKSMMGGANIPTPKSMMGGENKKIGGGSGCSAKMLGGKKKKTSKK